MQRERRGKKSEFDRQAHAHIADRKKKLSIGLSEHSHYSFMFVCLFVFQVHHHSKNAPGKSLLAVTLHVDPHCTMKSLFTCRTCLGVWAQVQLSDCDCAWLCVCVDVSAAHNVYNGLMLLNGYNVTFEHFHWAVSPTGKHISGSHLQLCTKYSSLACLLLT